MTTEPASRAEDALNCWAVIFLSAKPLMVKDQLAGETQILARKRLMVLCLPERSVCSGTK